MRLTCPNCDAQYEVDDSAIPDTGRDVQCSNCGHAWFQLPQGSLADEDEDDLYEGPTPETPAAPEPQPDPVPAPAPAAEPSVPPRRSLDETLATMLREEAEREAAARRSEAARIETQTDLGLAPPARTPAPVAMAPAAGPAGETVAEDPPTTMRPTARRDLLPDIEEINSTLRAGSELREDSTVPAPPMAAPPRAGFRTGFATMLVLSVLIGVVYMMAPRIAVWVPASAPYMQAYVEGIDSARISLDRLLQQAAGALRGVSGEGG